MTRTVKIGEGWTGVGDITEVEEECTITGVIKWSFLYLISFLEFG